MKKTITNTLLKTGLYFPLQRFNTNSLVHEAIKKDLPFFKKLTGPCNLIFDIGANKGYKSLAFSGMSKSVVAVEPQPDCLLYINSLTKWKRNIKIEPCAVSDKEGETELFISSDNVLSSISSEFIDKLGKSRFRSSEWNNSITVHCVTLASLIDKYGIPDFIKIDVEGSENLVLKTLNLPVKLISFEFSSEVIQIAEECISSILKVNPSYKFNYTSFDNYYQMKYNEFLPADRFIKEVLPEFKNRIMGGDIYASLNN